jgi:enoyl-CoA hydratase
MIREYRMASAFLMGHEFYEGIRAAVVDKDWRPRWSPDTIAQVDAAQVERHFVPVADDLCFDDK